MFSVCVYVCVIGLKTAKKHKIFFENKNAEKEIEREKTREMATQNWAEKARHLIDFVYKLKFKEKKYRQKK